MSQPAEFYFTCQSMEKDKIKYWNEVYAKISEKALAGQALSEADYNYIEGIGDVFGRIIQDLASALTVAEPKPDGQVDTHTELVGKDDAFKTTIVADVHTESNTKKVLEVGTGYVDWVIIAHASKDGRRPSTVTVSS